VNLSKDDVPRWTTSPRAHYDDLVDPRSATSSRHVRPTSTIRGALVVGFAVVFGIWLLSAYEIVRRLADLEVRATETQESFVRGERTLSTIRTSVLLGSIYLRDALIDTGAITREFYRDELNQIRADIARLVPAYVLDVQLPIERQHWGELQAQLDDYWASLDVVLDPNSAHTTGQAAALLRQRVVPRRDTILAIVDRLSALQRLSQQQYRIETSLLYAEARTRLLIIAGIALLVGIIVAFFATRHVARLHREIERQRLAERQNRHDLERLSARLVNVQEEERRSLARELHDAVGQALTAIKMEVGVALRGRDPDRQRASLEEARSIAETTLQSVRDLSQLLHPSMLDDFGLPEAVTAYLRNFSRRTGIRAQLTTERMEDRLSSDVEVCVYRIVQEATTNVARHSGATSCTVALVRRDGMLQLTIEDDGKGIDLTGRPPEARRGLGLIAMRERAQTLSGGFVIENRAEGGTRLIVRLPVIEAVTPAAAAADRLAG
jgi:signal transduction histidine kinase